MLYILLVNSALLQLGISPQSIDPSIRKIGQAFARAEGFSPQEAALLIASESAWVPSEDRAAVVARWIRAQKLDATDDMVATALSIVGIAGFSRDTAELRSHVS